MVWKPIEILSKQSRENCLQITAYEQTLIMVNEGNISGGKESQGMDEAEMNTDVAAAVRSVQCRTLPRCGIERKKAAARGLQVFPTRMQSKTNAFITVPTFLSPFSGEIRDFTQITDM